MGLIAGAVDTYYNLRVAFGRTKITKRLSLLGLPLWLALCVNCHEDRAHDPERESSARDEATDSSASDTTDAAANDSGATQHGTASDSPEHSAPEGEAAELQPTSEQEEFADSSTVADSSTTSEVSPTSTPDATNSPEAGTTYGTPTATVLYQRSPAIVRRTMALDARDIYWMEVSLEYGNLVMAAPKQGGGGGDVRTLGRWYDFGSSHSLSLDEDHAYWLRPDDDGVVIKVAKQGGQETSLPILRHDPAQSALNCIEVVGDVVWTASGGCTEIARMQTDGSNAQVWPIHDGRNGGVTTGFALNDEKVYCGNGALIYELDPATDQIRQVVTGQDHAGALLWVSDTLYFVDNSGVAGGNDRLKSWRPGEAEPSVLGPAFSFVGRLLHDEVRNVIYWVRGGHVGGGLARFTPGAQPELVLDQEAVLGPATHDADYIYWPGMTEVYRVPK